MALRAFVGLPIGPVPPLVDLVEELDGLGADLRVADPQHLHLTLAFLGQVAEDAVAHLAPALDRAAAGVHAFPMSLSHVGAFPSARRPRVVWAGVEDPEPVARLADRVRREVAAAGCAPDAKDFRAHVTLARVKGERGADRVVAFLREHGRDALGRVPADEVVLYQSTLTPGGSRHDRLHTARLGASS